MKNRRPRPQWQQNLIVSAVAEVFIILASQAAFNLVPYYIQQMGITDPLKITAYTAAYQSSGLITFAVFTPIWGILSDRYGRKPMFIRAIAATVVCHVLMAIAHTPTQLLVARIFQGCMTGTPTAASVLVATGTPKEHRAYALGLVQTAVATGTTVGPMVGGFVADGISYRASYWMSVILILLCLIMVLALVREPENSAEVTKQARSHHPLFAFKELGTSPYFILVTILTLGIGVALSLASPVVPVFIQELVGSSDHIATISGVVTGVAGLTAAASALFIGRAMDRIGARRTLLGCSLGTTIFFLPMGYVSSAWGFGMLQSIQGVFRGGIAPGISTLVVNKTRQEKIGVALGLNTSASSIGSALGPIAGAAVYAATSTPAVFLASACLVVASMVGLYFFQDRPDQQLV